jgi:predicted Zn-dependent protease
VSHYSNPEVPHEVNVSEKTPVRDFLRLSLGVCLLIVVIASVVFFTARSFAPRIPFRYETVLNSDAPRDASAPLCQIEGEKALQDLADELARVMALPDDMTLRVRYSFSSDPNAFASLGGNIVINRGALEHIHSENALAMILAHEIAHIKHRDPIVSMGGGVAVAVLFSALIGNSDGGTLVAWAIGMTQMSFSREQESAADKAALAALKKYYGDTRGADEFFAYLVEAYPVTANLPAFLSTHPATPSRLQDIRDSFSSRPDMLLKPLPEALQQLRQCKPESKTGEAS